MNNSIQTANLIVELLVEELPPKALQKLSYAFAEVLFAQLAAQHLTTDGSKLTVFATPRRMAAHITAVPAQAPDRKVEHKLMPASVGFKDGAPTPALLKKLNALGFDESFVAKLQTVNDGKADVLMLHSTASGADLTSGLQAALSEAVAKLPSPKVMSYQLHQGTALPGWDTVGFVRPAHGLVALHGAAIVPVTVLGLTAGRSTQGHRFEAQQGRIDIVHADDYETTLATQGAVVAKFDSRRTLIAQQLQAAAAQVSSQLGKPVQPIEDAALLDEVTALVERPNVLVCQFEDDFLTVPQECLILTMKANQKYFPLIDAAGKLTNRFLVVSNITPSDASKVIDGNERVVRPRLSDAKFFFDQDRKKTLESRAAGLSKVVYHNQLGTQLERSERVRQITHLVVQQWRDHHVGTYTQALKDEMDTLANKADEAARLAKADLLTDMVGEFPELQGIMGGYYARHEGLRDGVAIAIEDHYKPRFAGDALPRNHTGTVLALADKLETLCGMFGIGNVPTGDRDPFALRRHALGVIRLVVENQLPLDLPALIHSCLAVFGGLVADPQATQTALLGFIQDRFAILLKEQGVATSVSSSSATLQRFEAAEVDAVLSQNPAFLAQVPKRLAAVKAFAALSESAALAAANKRCGNILKKAAAGDVGSTVQPNLLQEPAELALWSAMQQVSPTAQSLLEAGDYTAHLQSLASLRAPVDAFFDGVMVNADDIALKANRLALLSHLHTAMNQVADLSKLAN